MSMIMETNEQDLLVKLDRLITLLERPEVSNREKSWTSAQCAAYLNRSVSYFMQNIAPLPSFPRAKRTETATGRSHREWKAQDVIDWNMKRFD